MFEARMFTKDHLTQSMVGRRVVSRIAFQTEECANRFEAQSRIGEVSASTALSVEICPHLWRVRFSENSTNTLTFLRVRITISFSPNRPA